MRKFIEYNGKNFEVVDSITGGYQIWNIGTFVEGYLPLCRLKQVQPFDGCTEVETDTLRAIKVDGAQVILDAIGGGQNTIESMERYVKKNSKSTKAYTMRKVEKIRKALKYMYKIDFDGTGKKVHEDESNNLCEESEEGEIHYYKLYFYHDENKDLASAESCSYCIKTEMPEISEEVALRICFGEHLSSFGRRLSQNLTHIEEISEYEAYDVFLYMDELNVRVKSEFGVYYVRG